MNLTSEADRLELAITVILMAKSGVLISVLHKPNVWWSRFKRLVRFQTWSVFTILHWDFPFMNRAIMLQRRQPRLALKCLVDGPPPFLPLTFSSLQTWWVEKGGKGSIDTLLFLFLFFRFRRVKNTSQTIREAANVLHHFSWASSFSSFSSFHKAGDGVQLSETSPPPLALSHAISSQMTGWELAWGP